MEEPNLPGNYASNDNGDVHNDNDDVCDDDDGNHDVFDEYSKYDDDNIHGASVRR